MADKAALVDQIKQAQRQSPTSKQAWWQYCDANLDGVKDPNRHDVSHLQDFLAKLQSGEIEVQASAWPQTQPQSRFQPQFQAQWQSQQSWGGAGGWAAPQFGGSRPFNTGIGLASAITKSQGRSGHFKSAWTNYTTLWGNGGKDDPNSYDDAFLTGFLDYLGNLGSMNLHAHAAHSGVNLEGFNAVHSSFNAAHRGVNPPNAAHIGMNSENGFMAGNKRAATGFAETGAPMKRAMISQDGGAPATGEDAEKATMVEQIKSMQRADGNIKEAWGQYCDQWLGGMRDPSRHELHVLQQFVAEHAAGVSF